MILESFISFWFLLLRLLSGREQGSGFWWLLWKIIGKLLFFLLSWKEAKSEFLTDSGDKGISDRQMILFLSRKLCSPYWLAWSYLMCQHRGIFWLLKKLRGLSFWDCLQYLWYREVCGWQGRGSRIYGLSWTLINLSSSSINIWVCPLLFLIFVLLEQVTRLTKSFFGGLVHWYWDFIIFIKFTSFQRVVLLFSLLLLFIPFSQVFTLHLMSYFLILHLSFTLLWKLDYQLKVNYDQQNLLLYPSILICYFSHSSTQSFHVFLEELRRILHYCGHEEAFS